MKISAQFIRVTVAVVFLSIALAALAFSGIYLCLFLTLLIILGNIELIKLCRLKEMDPCSPLIYITNLLLMLTAGLGKYHLIPFILTMAGVLSLIITMLRGQKGKIADMAVNLLCIFYGGWLPLHILRLRSLNADGFDLFGKHFSDGLGFTVLMFVVISVSDIAAYYVGTNFGKNKLCPSISPNKTIEGSLGATVAGIFGSMIIGHFIGISLLHSIVAGFLLSAAAQIGDLCESMIKRDAGVKDSGNLFPGHGGVLDRADSYVFTGAIAFYYFSMLVLR